MSRCAGIKEYGVAIVNQGSHSLADAPFLSGVLLLPHVKREFRHLVSGESAAPGAQQEALVAQCLQIMPDGHLGHIKLSA